MSKSEYISLQNLCSYLIKKSTQEISEFGTLYASVSIFSNNLQMTHLPFCQSIGCFLSYWFFIKRSSSKYYNLIFSYRTHFHKEHFHILFGLLPAQCHLTA